MRPVRLRLSALLLAGVAVAGVLTQTTTSAGAAPDSQDYAARVKAAQQDVKAFQSLVEETAQELRVATEAYEQTKARAEGIRAKADATRAAAGDAVASSTAARAKLSEVVLRNFMNPPRSTLSAVLSSGKDALSEAVLAAHDREAIEGNQRDLLRESESSRVKAEGLVIGAEQLEEQATAAEQAASAQAAALGELAQQNEAKLSAAFKELQKAEAAQRAFLAEQARLREIARQKALAAARAARDAAARRAAEQAARDAARNASSYTPIFDSGGATCAGASTDGYANGFLPDSALCSIGGGHRLRADAAAAFKAMSAAYGGLCVTDSYRSYAAQVDVYRRKPTLAAIPGNSNHGLGIAVDFCGGIERFGSSAHEWMDNNAGRFGWVHPSWAQQGGSKPEAWHWEFRG